MTGWLSVRIIQLSGIAGHGDSGLVFQWGSTIKSPWVPTVTSWYPSPMGLSHNCEAQFHTIIVTVLRPVLLPKCSSSNYKATWTPRTYISIGTSQADTLTTPRVTIPAVCSADPSLYFYFKTITYVPSWAGPQRHLSTQVPAFPSGVIPYRIIGLKINVLTLGTQKREIYIHICIDSKNSINRLTRRPTLNSPFRVVVSLGR